MEPPDLARTPPSVLHTGSIASFVAPGAGKVKAVLEQLRHVCTITYDPNIRPALLGTHAEARCTFEELVHLTHVVKLSDEDARWLYPEKAPEETATHILALGADLAVITKGPSGSLLATSSTILSIPAVTSPVVDTIGAGDSYMSALILGLLTRGTDGYAPSVLEQLGRTAAAAAAITVGRAGARPPPEMNSAPGSASAPAGYNPAPCLNTCGRRKTAWLRELEAASGTPGKYGTAPRTGRAGPDVRRMCIQPM